LNSTYLNFLPKSLGSAADTVVGHGGIGGAHWLLASYLALSPVHYQQPFMMQVQSLDWARSILCGVLSILMDTDHFIAGGRLSMTAALTLAHRPFAHTVLFFLLACGLSYLCAVKGWVPFSTPLLIATAWGGHLIRDAIKRGFTWGPHFLGLGDTARLPYPVYLLAVALFPLPLSWGLATIKQTLPTLPL
jgi:hypothetical protein